MNIFLQSILSYLLIYKYLALFVVTFLAAFALPLPTAPSLMAAAAFAGQGYMSMPLVIATAIVGNVTGDNASYWLSRKFGKPVLYLLGLKKIFISPTYDWVEAEVVRYRAVVVFFSRFNAATTIPVNIVAGLLPVPFQPFLLYDILGETVQVFMFAGAGFLFGSNWQAIYSVFGKFTLAIVLVVALVLLLLSKNVHRHLMRRRSKHLASLEKNAAAPDGNQRNNF